MKNVYILQNSNLSFDMDISKLFCPSRYVLYLITNEFSLNKLKNRKQEYYFEKIWKIEDFSFDCLKNIITQNQDTNNNPLEIVTNAEEAVIVCGNLRIFFDIDKLNFDRFNNKIVMKQLLEKQNFLIPKHTLFDKELYKKNPNNYLTNVLVRLSFPLIAKPIDQWVVSVSKNLSREFN